MRTLAEFHSWFMKQNIGSLVAGDAFDYGPVKSAIIHRAPPFQVEFLVVRPGKGAAPLHRHPDVDSIEVGVAGIGLDFNVNGTLYHMVPGSMLYVGPTDWHSVSEIPGNGAAFYSIQKWLNGVKPSSVGLNWEGAIDSLAGPEHFALIRKRGMWKRSNRKSTLLDDVKRSA